MAPAFGKDARDPRGRSGAVVRTAGGAREDQSCPGRAARSPRRDPRRHMSPSETISPTAHYTGYVWARNGLSHPRLETLEGRVMFESLRPISAVSTTLGGPSLESYLLARHRAIDALLDNAIEEH